MTTTLWRASLRHHLRHRWQLALAVIGVALGVAVVVAVDLANESAKRAFSLSMESLSGHATHRISAGPLGVDEALYARLRLEGVRPSAPVVEGYARVGERTLHLLGLDPFAEAPFRDHFDLRAADTRLDIEALLTRPASVALAAETAMELGVEMGDTLPLELAGRTTTATVAGLFAAGDGFAGRVRRESIAMDIATAQELLGMPGRLSHIDLRLADERQAAALRQRLPAGVTLEPAAQRRGVMAEMAGAFHTNLTALSLLALLVGTFLVYNTMTFSVVQRMGLIGTLRALGTKRGELFLLLGGEALAIGALGTLVGLLLGTALGYGLVQLVVRTINDLYFVLAVSELFLPPAAFGKGVLLGLGATLGAAWVPAWSAARTPPRLNLLRSHAERRSGTLIPWAAAAGASLWLAAAGLLLWPTATLVAGFVALFLLVVGYALTVPWAMRSAAAALARLLGPRVDVPTRFALRGINASLSRTALAVAALTVAVAVSIGMGVMIDSFRQTVADWLGYSLRADIYLSPPSGISVRRSPPLAAGVVERVLATPGVSHVSRYREVEVDTPGGPLLLQPLDLAPESRAGFRFKIGEPQRAWPAFAAGAVLVSEPLAFRRGLTAGDSITIETPGGARQFPIAGVYYDYESDRGIALMARSTYDRHWNDPDVSGLGIYLTADADADDVAATLRRNLSGLQRLRIRASAELRAQSLAIFDRTFAITEVLRLLAVLVAFVGILGALMALQLERGREFAILRATGMTPRELRRLITRQTGLLGLFAGFLALPLGMVLALVLIEVINRRAFGWSLATEVDPVLALQGVLLAVIAALLAGVYPARRMAAMPPAVALKEE